MRIYTAGDGEFTIQTKLPCFPIRIIFPASMTEFAEFVSSIESQHQPVVHYSSRAKSVLRLERHRGYLRRFR